MTTCAVWSIPLEGYLPYPVFPENLHAVSSWLIDGDHKAQQKHWRARHPVQVSKSAHVLTVATLDMDAAARLLERASLGSSVRFGSKHELIISDGPVPVAEQTLGLSWAPSGVSSWTVSFNSPTFFAAGKDSYSPWPDPVSIMRSLLGRWNALYPYQQLRAPEDRGFARIQVVSFVGQTVSVRPTRRESATQGFIGEINVRCDDPSIAQLAELLFDWANFAGLGARTTRGFGDVSVVPHR